MVRELEFDFTIIVHFQGHILAVEFVCDLHQDSLFSPCSKANPQRVEVGRRQSAFLIKHHTYHLTSIEGDAVVSTCITTDKST